MEGQRPDSGDLSDVVAESDTVDEIVRDVIDDVEDDSASDAPDPAGDAAADGPESGHRPGLAGASCNFRSTFFPGFLTQAL